MVPSAIPAFRPGDVALCSDREAPTIPVCIAVVLLIEVKVVRRVVSTGNKVVETILLLVLTSTVVDDSSDGVAETDFLKFVVDDSLDGVAETDFLKFVVDRVGTDVTMAEEDVRVGGVGREEVLSDDEVPVVNRGVWLVGDASTLVVVVGTALGDLFWFPTDPGGPFLFPSRPGGVSVFIESRAARAFRKGGEFMRL
jgi:hypothetical protein